MTKVELRKHYLNERLSLSDEAFARYNFDICENFFAELDLQNVKVLHSFIPMENTREPNTRMIIYKATERYPSLKISIPKINVSAVEIENYYYEGPEQLKVNAWGIPEPQYGVPTMTEEIDMVLVPMLIADQNGHRVGYGKGFYDKFLATCKPSCIPVGLCFYEPVASIDDVNALDMPLKYCVTPGKLYRF